MNTSATNPAPTVCSRCGSPVSPHSFKGLCRRCLARYSLPQSDAARPPDPGLRISCPQCGHRVELPEDAALSDIRCDSCGTHFSVVDEQAANQSAATLGRVGHFEISEKLGSGAFGTVWKARDTQLDRWVAIKIPRHRHLEPAEVEKLLREARAAAQLHHPNIVSVFEVGREDDLVYIVCDFVDGVSLADRLAAVRMGPRAAAELCRKLASALEHAHGQGVIHRDVKPGNILLDVQGEPHLTDFGLARREAGEVTMTLDGQLLGTPAYMSPEQARGEAHQADPRTDLYSIGVVLFQLLTGELPFRGNTRMLVQQVIHDEPPSPRKLNAHVPRDLETICLKCLEKDPGGRYGSARELGDELDRFLRGEPILARPVGPLGRTWRWSRRKPVLAGMTGVVALLLLTITVVSVAAAWRISTAQKGEQREAYYSSIALANQYIEQGSIDRALDTLWKCPEQYRHWEWGHLLYLCHQDAASFQAHTETNVTAVMFSPDNRWLVSQDALGAAKVWDWQAETQVFAFGSSSNRAGTMAFHPSGTQLAAALGTNGVSVWATTNWQLLFTVGARGNEGSALAYSPEGQRLVIGGSDGTITVWDSGSGQELRRLETTNQPIQRVAFSPDGKRLVTVGERSACVWDLENGTLLRNFPGDHVDRTSAGDSVAADVSPRHLAPPQTDSSADSRRRLPSLRPDENAPPTTAPLATNEIVTVFADDAGEHFATIDTHGRLTLWPIGRTPQHLIAIRGSQPTAVRRAFFSPDSRWVLNAGEDNTARLWTLTGEERLAINERVHQTLFTADGTKMITLGTESWATLWDLNHGRRLKVLRGHTRMVKAVALSRDGRFAATGDEGGTVKVWSASLGRELGEEEVWHHAAAYSPDGRWIVSCPFSQGWVLRSSQSGRVLLRVHAANEAIFSVAFSPDSRRIVTAGTHKTAKAWDVESGRLLLTLRGHKRQVWVVAYSRDGRFVATGSFDGTAKVWDAQNGQEVRTYYMSPQQIYDLTSYSNVVWSVEFDAASSRLITGHADGMARVWEIQTGRLLTELRAGQTPRTRLHADGKQLTTYASDGSIMLWELSSGRMIKKWQARGRVCGVGTGLAVSTDGRRLIASSSIGDGYGADSGTVEVWDAESAPREVLTLRGREMFSSATLSPDGRRVAATSVDFGLHQWESFPWKTGAHAENTGQSGGHPSLAAQVRVYAKHYWRERLKAEHEGVESESRAVKVIELPVDQASLPQRDAKATPQQIDLAEYYTRELTEPFHPNGDCGRQDNDLSALPAGLVSLGGVVLDVRGVIQLRRAEPLGGPWEVIWNNYPVRVEGIPVQQPAQRLHILLGATYAEVDGTVIGSLVLHYADGDQASLDLVYGRDVRQWGRLWYDDPVKDNSNVTDRGKVVWTGTNPVVAEYGDTIRLYLTTRENPRPGATITTADLVSALSRSGPFIIALTVE